MSQIKFTNGIYFCQGKPVFQRFGEGKAYGRNRNFLMNKRGKRWNEFFGYNEVYTIT